MDYKRIQFAMGLLFMLHRLGVAQQDCSVVIQSGIINTQIIQGSQQSQSAFRDFQCHSEFKTHDEAVNAGISVGVPVYGVPLRLGATFSQQQRDTWKASHCSDVSSSSSYAQANLEIKHFVSPEALTAWTRCIEIVNAFRPGLKCSLATADNRNMTFSLNYTPLGDADATRPKVRSSVITGARVAGNALPNNQLLPVNAEIASAGSANATTISLQRIGLSPVSIVVNTTRGACDAYVPAPKVTFTVGATIRPTAERPEVVSQGFHFDDGTGDDCGRNFDSTVRYCVNNAESVRDWVGPFVSSSNCPTNASFPKPVRRDPGDAKCVLIDYHMQGCGGGLFGCKGRGWLVFDITVNGTRYEATNLQPQTFPAAPIGNQLSTQFDYQYLIAPGLRNIKWNYIVDVVKSFGTESTRIHLSDAQRSVSGIQTSISADGKLFVDLSNAVR